jgi:hypothetical protein
MRLSPEHFKFLLSIFLHSRLNPQSCFPNWRSQVTFQQNSLSSGKREESRKRNNLLQFFSHSEINKENNFQMFFNSFWLDWLIDTNVLTEGKQNVGVLLWNQFHIVRLDLEVCSVNSGSLLMCISTLISPSSGPTCQSLRVAFQFPHISVLHKNQTGTCCLRRSDAAATQQTVFCKVI